MIVLLSSSTLSTTEQCTIQLRQWNMSVEKNRIYTSAKLKSYREPSSVAMRTDELTDVQLSIADCNRSRSVSSNLSFSNSRWHWFRSNLRNVTVSYGLFSAGTLSCKSNKHSQLIREATAKVHNTQHPEEFSQQLLAHGNVRQLFRAVDKALQWTCYTCIISYSKLSK
jgi:hypothetical protein